MSARILVVDDIPANVRLLDVKLTAEYFDVLTAQNGVCALQIAEDESPDIILSDVMMPGMDGFELCECLKANPATQHIPVVMVTALSDVSDRVRGLEAGADDFLTKPVNDIALFARVRSLVRLKQTMDELRFRRAAANQADLIGGQAGEVITGTGAHVLLAEAGALNAGRIKGYLQEDGQKVTLVTSIAEAIEASRAKSYELLIVNLHLGDEDGLRLCSQIRSHDATRHTPILLIIDEDELPHLAKGLDLGVTDYLIKPVDRNELHARCRTQVRRNRYHEQLRQVLRTSVSMAYTDPLTSVYNRRYMNAHLERKIMEIAETAKPVSILMIDIDFFKNVNDTHGHAVGDIVLQSLTALLSKHLREFDMIARYGGEEFVIIMSDTDGKVALKVADRLRSIIASQTFAKDALDGGLRITISLGCATATDPMETSESLLKRADDALYKAKKNGRNCTVFSESPRIGNEASVALSL
ncbi:MAG: PleD family two-component system response regulator [Kiloniellales bacterium]|nr:PleD family two-component system response regulator [Kiloniellales bacterium]